MNPHLPRCHHQNSKSPYQLARRHFQVWVCFYCLLWMLENAIEYLISYLRLKLSSLSTVKMNREQISSLKLKRLFVREKHKSLPFKVSSTHFQVSSRAGLTTFSVLALFSVLVMDAGRSNISI